MWLVHGYTLDDIGREDSRIVGKYRKGNVYAIISNVNSS